MDDENNPITEVEQSQPAPRILSPEAQRALAEAAQRRALADQQRGICPKKSMEVAVWSPCAMAIGRLTV